VTDCECPVVGAWQAAKQSLERRYHDTIKIGPTQIKLDTRLLGDRWKAVLEEILSCRDMA